MYIHDLNQDQAKKIRLNSPDTCIIADNKTIRPCVGCFGCWVKTPGRCVIKDGYENMGELLSKTTELVIISKMTYGGFSPFVKNVLDRSISYVHPYFEIRNTEMHHQRRYDNVINIRAFFYGDSITPEEKKTARNYVEAVCTNLDAKFEEVQFVSINELMEGGLC